MWQINGYIKEKLNNTVRKAVFVNPIEGGYEYVTQHYFDSTEKYRTRKHETWELHPENCKYKRKNTLIAYIDNVTGNPVGMGETTQVVYPPNVLRRMIKTDHVEAAGRAATGGGNTNLIMCLLCFGIGAAIFLVIGMNMDGIVGAFNGGNKAQAAQQAKPFVESLVARWLSHA